MKILHITPSSDGYEKVFLIANRISKTNHLALIEDKEGQQKMTGGFLLEDTELIRGTLDLIPKDKQYEFVKSFKVNPFVKFYAEENQSI